MGDGCYAVGSLVRTAIGIGISCVPRPMNAPISSVTGTEMTAQPTNAVNACEKSMLPLRYNDRANGNGWKARPFSAKARFPVPETVWFSNTTVGEPTQPLHDPARCA